MMEVAFYWMNYNLPSEEDTLGASKKSVGLFNTNISEIIGFYSF
jgi:hypothetical protein